MKFKLLSLSSILLTILLGCNSATQNKSIEDYVGIPFTAKLQKSEMMLLTHLDTDGSRYNTNESFTMPADTIPTIQRVTIISYPDENLKLLVEGSRDYRNVESFTVELGKKEAIYLPTNRGFIGFSEENHFLIMQSYQYYSCGGRYNRIEAFDCEGKRICSMDAKMEEFANYPSIEELSEMDD